MIKGDDVNLNPTLDLLNNRMSLRKYKDKPVSEEDLNQILRGAMRAPTAGNMMMYSILVIKNEEKKKRLSETCDNQPFIAKAPLILIFLADMHRMYRYFDECNVKDYCLRKGKEYKKPDLSQLFLAAGDAFIAAQNAVVAAEALGVGSCYIGDIVEHYEIHRELLKLPDGVFPVCMLCMGYYPENAERKLNTRFDRKYIIYNEEYRDLTRHEYESMYIEYEKKVTAHNIFDAENFGQLTYARKFGSGFSDEMERSIKVIMEHWNNY